MQGPAQLRQQGSAALAAVLILLVGMTLLSLFTNRSLIFEQKSSANQARATKAMEAAEAGLEWALANLNYARKVGAACAALSSPGATDKTFRDRYLDPDNTGSYGGPFSTLTPGCAQSGSGWSCSCQTAGNPSLGSGSGPAFRVAFQQVTGQPTMVEIIATGCTSPQLPCDPAATASADATATVRQIAQIQAALATPPAAALTAKGNVSVGGSGQVVNTDTATNGITVNSGGTSSVSAALTLPGSPASASQVASDTSLSSLSDDKMFQTFFGQDKDTVKNSSTTTQVTCSDPCNTQLTTLVDQGARVIWVNGDMHINSNITLGSTDRPVILIVDGNAQINGTANVYGLVYSTATTWDDSGGGNSTVHGASIAEGSFSATGNPTFSYDPNVLKNLALTTGQFAKVPGSWRDF